MAGIPGHRRRCAAESVGRGGKANGEVHDLTVPEDVLETLRFDLDQLGLEPEQILVRARVGHRSRAAITVLKDGPRSIYLICLKQPVINADTWTENDLQLMSFLQHYLPETGTIVITAEGRDALPYSFYQIYQTWRSSQREVKFIPWRWLGRDLPPSGADRLVMLADMLGVQPPSSRTRPAGSGVSAIQLEPADKGVIVGIINRLSHGSFGQTREFFENLVQESELPEEWEWEAMNAISRGVSEGFAGQLVDWAESRGRYPDKGGGPRLTVLGQILVALAKRAGADDQDILAGIRRQYEQAWRAR